MEMTSTIASLATPPGRGGISIIRISGTEAVSIASRLFTGEIPRGVTHALHYGHIKDPSTGEMVDEVMLGVMLAPRTYTREDVVEINCHGGPVPVQRVLELVIGQGATPAEPGEFTRRAFLNGRMDLAQAEAVLDVINARSGEAERLAQSQLRGALSSRIVTLREKLLLIASEMEAHIDFPEDEIEPGTIDRMNDGLAQIADDINSMARTFEGGRLMHDGLKIAIIGRPNVGKSSLMNALLKQDRAIVTEVAGTTRDTIEESLTVRGLPVNIIDTAGIRESHDMVEREGVRRSIEAMQQADLVLAVLDSSRDIQAEDRTVLDKTGQVKSITVLNKIDKAGVNKSGIDGIEISAKTGEGMDALRDAIYHAALGEGGLVDSEGVVITSMRHKAALDGGIKSINAARDALNEGKPLEIVAMELRDALNSLGSIVGEITPDDLLNNIFSRFCIGK